MGIVNNIIHRFPAKSEIIAVFRRFLSRINEVACNLLVLPVKNRSGCQIGKTAPDLSPKSGGSFGEAILAGRRKSYRKRGIPLYGKL